MLPDDLKNEVDADATEITQEAAWMSHLEVRERMAELEHWF